MEHSLHNKIFHGVLLFVSIFVFASSMANAVYFGKLSDRPSAAISHSAATAMMWVNILILIGSFVVFLWTAYRFFSGDILRKKLLGKAADKMSSAPQKQPGTAPMMPVPIAAPTQLPLSYAQLPAAPPALPAVPPPMQSYPSQPPSGPTPLLPQAPPPMYPAAMAPHMYHPAALPGQVPAQVPTMQQ